MTYPNSEIKACRVLSKIPGEETGKRPRKVGEVADAGSVISCLFYDVSRSIHPHFTSQPTHEDSHIITTWLTIWIALHSPPARRFPTPSYPRSLPRHISPSVRDACVTPVEPLRSSNCSRSWRGYIPFRGCSMRMERMNVETAIAPTTTTTHVAIARPRNDQPTTVRNQDRSLRRWKSC